MSRLVLRPMSSPVLDRQGINSSSSSTSPFVDSSSFFVGVVTCNPLDNALSTKSHTKRYLVIYQ